VKEREDFPTTDSVPFFPLTNQPSTNANQRDGNVMRISLPLPAIAQLEEHRHSYRRYEAETQLVADDQPIGSLFAFTLSNIPVSRATYQYSIFLG